MLRLLNRFHSRGSEYVSPLGVKSMIENVKHIILTSSCKGGVGKSTIALNTAVSLSRMGYNVGLFDADIYGPSLPTMTLTTDNALQNAAEDRFLPVIVNGIECVSLGNKVPKDKALMWKGPVVGQVVKQLMFNAMWTDVDYLIVDTPPGTGDVHMALNDIVPIDGTILVSTPQDVAMADVIRNVDMFKKMDIHILGVVTNMDGYSCPCCNEITKIFDGDLVNKMVKDNNLDWIGSIPIHGSISASADNGYPAVLQYPDSQYAKVFAQIAEKIVEKVPKDSRPKGF